MSPLRRILISTFGSAGDLFPLLPVIDTLRAGGHDVRCVVPRSIGLYLRRHGVAVYAIGNGSEMRVLRDASIATNRFGGWASWRRVISDYVLPTLSSDVVRIRAILDEWRPDIVVTMSFPSAACLAINDADIAWASFSIYPQQALAAAQNPLFPQLVRDGIADALGRPVQRDRVAALVWGIDRTTAILHDDALLTGDSDGYSVLGFPYWDHAFEDQDETSRARRWLRSSNSPAVLVTAGSFLGVGRDELWRGAVLALRRLGVRGLFVGVRSQDLKEVADGDDIMSVGFVPLSRILPHVDVVVHHGGVGTMFATLRAGRPAVVVPQAFDQGHNAALVQRSGAGVNGWQRDLTSSVGQVLSDSKFGSIALHLANRLQPSDVATQQAVEHVLSSPR